MPDTACWPVDWSADPEAVTADPLLRDRAEALAVGTLRHLTGYRVGGCAITVRPHWTQSRGTWLVTTTGVPMHIAPRLESGSWKNGPVCGGACPQPRAVILPGPVGRIDSVQVGGVTLDPDVYMMDGAILVRVDGGEWPVCDETFEVTYLQGAPVDALASYLAGLLAAEYVKAFTGASCLLPAGTTSVARAGVSFEIVAPTLESGTGIPAIDAWVTTINPYRLTGPTIVSSVDRPAIGALSHRTL